MFVGLFVRRISSSLSNVYKLFSNLSYLQYIISFANFLLTSNIKIYICRVTLSSCIPLYQLPLSIYYLFTFIYFYRLFITRTALTLIYAKQRYKWRKGKERKVVCLEAWGSKHSKGYIFWLFHSLHFVYTATHTKGSNPWNVGEISLFSSIMLSVFSILFFSFSF